jgi:hypothetical protein
MEASSTSTSAAAKSHDDQEDHPILCIEPGIRPIDHATTAATLVATGHSRRMVVGSCNRHGHRLALTEQRSFGGTTKQDRKLGHMGGSYRRRAAATVKPAASPAIVQATQRRKNTSVPGGYAEPT